MSRKKKKRESKISDSWLLPYADMLTLLLALFIILFAASEIDSQKYQQLAEFFRGEFMPGGSGILDEDQEIIPDEKPEEGPEQEEGEEDVTPPDEGEEAADTPPLEHIKAEMDAYIAENELGGKFDTEMTDVGLMITILDDVFFDMGSAEVREDAQQTAREVSELLYVEPPLEVIVSGHTDDVPISNENFASNWELSVSRAVNFMAVILENEDLDPTKFSAKGYGEFQPAVPNTSAENRQKNRRVEILVLPNEE